MRKTVVIDCFPESALRYRGRHVVVAVDVIRATTTLVTAAALGRRCFPVGSVEAARSLARRLENPLLAGELDGGTPDGFEINNSPAEVARRDDTRRSLILLSTSGTQLIVNARHSAAVYVACLRNCAATARHLIQSDYSKVAIIGAGSRGEFREEDQMCCAWIAAELIEAGYVPEDARTNWVVQHWSGADLTSCLVSRSVDYLMRTRQTRDLVFILQHVNDLDCACQFWRGEVVQRHAADAARTSHLQTKAS